MRSARRNLLPGDERLAGRERHDVAARRRVGMALLELVAHLARLFFDLLELRGEQLHAVRRQEDVRRLQVTVDDAARMQRGKGGQHTEPDGQRFRGGQGAAIFPAGRLANSFPA